MEMPSGAKCRYFLEVHVQQRSSLWLPWQRGRAWLQQAESLQLEQHLFASHAWQMCRWRGGAEGLVLHIAASMVVAYEKHKDIPSKEAIAKWKACQALVQGHRSGYLQLEESDGEMLKRWERTTMLKVPLRSLLAYPG